ncbi:MAG: hypothetical protein KDA97_09320 [Acidimicrobiales bacterium]|nr:hypothetical protein [Acidimicrobiales bacterium]
MVALAFGVLAVGTSGSVALARSAGDPAPAGDDISGRPSMDASEIPAEVVAPAAAGDGSVASFAAFLGTVREFTDGLPSPRPDTTAGLVDATDTSAAGTVAAVELRSSTERLGELAITRIDLVIELELEVVAKADPRTGAVHWTRTLWSGDPVMAEPLLERLEAELGPGPVGAEAVLFGNVVDADGQPVLATFDGLVQDGTGEARVSLVLSEPDGALTSVGTARSRLEEGSPGGG